ncbi:MAG: MerR family transcriptional regulator [Arenicella sp.]
MSLTGMRISEIANEVGVSAHTLRYYEKIGLLKNVPKDGGGQRVYNANHIIQIKFIRRAQRMHFSLDEIKQLLLLDSQTTMPKPEVQSLVENKLLQIDQDLAELTLLKSDLSKLLGECQKSTENEKCPILEGMKSQETSL